MLTAKEMRDGAYSNHVSRYHRFSWPALETLMLLQRKAGRWCLHSWLLEGVFVLAPSQIRKLKALGYKVTVDDDDPSHWEIKW